jgi:hypothetical protein
MSEKPCLSKYNFSCLSYGIVLVKNKKYFSDCGKSYVIFDGKSIKIYLIRNYTHDSYRINNITDYLLGEYTRYKNEDGAHINPNNGLLTFMNPNYFFPQNESNIKPARFNSETKKIIWHFIPFDFKL